MKKILVCFFIYLLLSCSGAKSDSIEEKKIDVTYYKTSNENRIFKEKIDFLKISNKSSKTFVYKYQNFKEGNDTIKVFKDSLLYNNEKMIYISSKEFKNHIKVKKYLAENIYSKSQVYYNDSIGMILSKITNASSNIIVKYSKNDVSEAIQEQIINDSIFFGSVSN